MLRNKSKIVPLNLSTVECPPTSIIFGTKMTTVYILISLEYSVYVTVKNEISYFKAQSGKTGADMRTVKVSDMELNILCI